MTAQLPAKWVRTAQVARAADIAGMVAKVSAIVSTALSDVADVMIEDKS